MGNRKTVSAALVLLLFCSLAPSVARAGVPTEQVRSTVDKVLAILRERRRNPENKKNEARAELRQVISGRFDFEEMAKRSLATHWRRRSPQEQREFVKLFSDLLEKSYADKIESYNGEKVVYARENQDKDHAEVDTKVVTKKGEEFSINYKLRDAGGQWRVYDVVIENISLVNNYRSQFNRVLTKSPFEELLQKMRDRQFEGPEKKEGK